MSTVRRWKIALPIRVAAALTLIAASPAVDVPSYTAAKSYGRTITANGFTSLRNGHELQPHGYGPSHVHQCVRAPQAAYREFTKSGKWPDRTMFVVEERMSSSQGSINKAGQFQTGLMGIGVEVKDEKRFLERWAYFNFDEDAKSARPNPKAGCWQCHEDHAAVEHSFVQFHPTLKPVAQKFGTYTDR